MRRPTASLGSAVFFLLAPGVVVGLIPWWLTEGWHVREPLPYWMLMRVLGAILLVAGLIALVRAFVRFVVEGFGTPAPLAAPERLVVGGVYRDRHSSAYGRRGRSVLREQRQLRCHPLDLRHGPHPARRRRRGERGGVHGERSLHRSPDDYQRSETTYTLSQGFVSC